MNPSFFAIVVLIFTVNSIHGNTSLGRSLGYYSTTDLFTCESCISNSDKLCSEDEANYTSYCCSSDDTSTFCGYSSSNYECTTDSGISGDAKFIL